MPNSILGRGLSSLIPNRLNQTLQEESVGSSEPTGLVIDKSEKVQQLPLSQIESNPWQPRENINHDDLEDLINSIKKHGILQPLIVTQKTSQSYQLIAGERRLQACRILGMATLPCLVRKVADIEKLELALVENLQRTDLNPIEEARAYQKLIDQFSLTQEEVAEKVGKKRATIANTLRLLELPSAIQQALKDKKITAGHAKVILSAETDKARLQLFQKIIKSDLTVRELTGEIRKIKVKSHFRTVEKDLETAEQEEQLRKFLGTKVSITKKGQAGQINIEFYSLEELHNLIERIIGSIK